MLEMKPAALLPFHDPSGVLFPHLDNTLPFLKRYFGSAYLSISPATAEQHPERVARLEEDPFFRVNFNPPGSLPGVHFLSAYRNALDECPDEQLLHLCDIDRVAFALGTEYRPLFIEDLRGLERGPLPLLFQRSSAAWETYPQNYYEIEHLVIKAGRLIFGRYLDFAWSYLVLRAHTLRAILPEIESEDFGILIEIVLLLRKQLHTKNVDWLAWEDAYILGRGDEELRTERACSAKETYKRLQALLPFFRHLEATLPPLEKWER